MNTDSILRRRNYSRETFKAIEHGRKKEARKAGAVVAAKVTDAEKTLKHAESRLKIARKNVKRINKILKKYKKTGDESLLNIL